MNKEIIQIIKINIWIYHKWMRKYINIIYIIFMYSASVSASSKFRSTIFNKHQVGDKN